MHDLPAATLDEFIGAWELYREPVLTAIIAGVVLGYLGVFVVVRRMVFVTAAISQASGLGVALAFYLQIHLGLALSPVVGAFLAALASTLVFSIPAGRLHLSREALLGFVYLATWSGAVLVGDRISQEAHDIAAILFGTAVLVRPEDFHGVAACGAFVLGIELLIRRGLVFAAFDRDTARVQGLPVALLDIVHWILMALMVAVATRALGVLPVFAFAVLPALASLTLFSRMSSVLILAALYGGVAGGVGYLVAFFYDLPVGASQAWVAAMIFLVHALLRLGIDLLRRGAPIAATSQPGSAEKPVAGGA